MAIVAPSSPQTLEPNLDKSDARNPSPESSAPDPVSSTPPAAAAASGASASDHAPASDPPNPNPAVQVNPTPVVLPPPPPPPPVASFAASFRPLEAPPVPPQYTAVPTPMAPNPGFQTMMAPQVPGVQPPGVSPPFSIMPPGAASGAGAVAVPAPPMPPGGSYQVGAGQQMNAVPMAYGQVPNGYMQVPMPSPLPMPPQGMARYPTPYPTMFRPGFPPRPMPPPGVIPQLPRPSFPVVRGAPPGVNPLVRPPVAAAVEKPQTTVYVGKIASTVDNEFLLSVLKLCGPVKSWKRPQNPSDGTPKGFGFCEFESAEGVLRSLRLINKLNIDGQELGLNINKATRDYLERYVEKKIEREKLKQADAGGSEKEDESTNGAEKQESPKKAEEEKKDSEDSGEKEHQDNSENFGIVTAEDREADRDALEKLTSMIEERLKNKPLPPPSAQTPLDGSGKSEPDVPSKLRGGDADVDIIKNDAAEDKINDETSSENKASTDNGKNEISSPDRSRRHDSRNRERDRERDVKRDKERELERVEKDRERERAWREREREYKIREAERVFKDRVKDWESREKDKEYRRKHEKERERERERERRKEIMRQEEESDDDDLRKRRRRSDIIDEKRKKRQREKEEDLDDRLKEEEEIAEAKKRAIEEQPQNDELVSPCHMDIDNEKPVLQEKGVFVDDNGQTVVNQDCDNDSGDGDKIGDANQRNGVFDDSTLVPLANLDMKQNNSAPARKLGFGLIGSGKRTTVPSVFHEDDDEDVDEKKMRPLVPIDYSTEELQAIQTNSSGAQPNLVAAAEFAKRISGGNVKEEKSDTDKERNRRSNDKTSLRERDRKDSESTRSKDESREKMHDKGHEKEKDREVKLKTDNKKLFDAKQLIDMIPKTKEELFVYEINWQTYDKHELHERMKPWISKKITEFLGEEEPTLVDYIVSCTRDHVHASKMLELLQGILDDEAEMFVLKMWRMLIFEIKKLETGLSVRTKS